MRRTKRQIELEEAIQAARLELDKLHRERNQEKNKELLGKCYWYDGEIEKTYFQVTDLSGWCPKGFRFIEYINGEERGFRIFPNESFGFLTAPNWKKGFQEIHIGIFDIAWRGFYERMLARIPPEFRINPDEGIIELVTTESGRAHLDPETGATVYVPD